VKEVIEYHPRVNENQDRLESNKIILGSFPTWSLTISGVQDIIIDLEKEANRLSSGDIQYFYGSANNRFWTWYQKHIDETINRNDVDSIHNSLVKNRIGITDVIFSCVRKGKSALDKDLSKRIYNHCFFRYPNKNETIKILCTSKGVMNEMLLNKHFFKLHNNIKINIALSDQFQDVIAASLGSNSKLVMPLVKVLENTNGGIIECFAIPSPGSPYRRLIDFGHTIESNEMFLQKYLMLAFSWFKT
jgi:G:T/U-mismatch repair DNA glycosylase